MSPTTIILVTLLIVVVFSNDVTAFGAGSIPGYLDGRAFRHGDIEEILAQLVMVAGTSPNPLNFFASAAGLKGPKFSALNVQRVYFGNWLRDYSQAVDVGTLGRGIKLGTIRILVWVMGFMAHGYSTNEFEVNNDRLGVYRPEEHIDNPRDYADNKDARIYDRRLRGPVDPRELEVDPRTGMKNYIANENGGWTTSTQYIRQSLFKAIEIRRRARSDADLYEALRLLGQALHTLEDLTAHSNWVELALIEMGYRNVFPHVGENTAIYLGGKNIYPLVTGTFGGMDFIHSLLGEASDQLSQTQISDVYAAVTKAGAQRGNSSFTLLQKLLGELPGHEGREFSNEIQGIQARASRQAANMQRLSDSYYQAGASSPFDLQSGDLDPEKIAQEIYPILEFRDRIVKFINNTIDKIPGLTALVEKINDVLTIWVLSLLEPFIKPLVRLVLTQLNAGSALVISNEAQYEVFNNPNSSDPTHSMLSKDHFSCYLNEPAGQVAIVIVRHTVQQVVAAWSDPSIDPHRAIESIMSVFCHPSLLNRNNPVQIEMFGVVERWINSHPDKDRVLQGLTKEGVRAGRHHDSVRENAMGRHDVAGGHSHGSGRPSFGGYIPPSQGVTPNYGNQGGGSGGIGPYIQQAQEIFGGGSGGGVGSYVQQAKQTLQGGGDFAQNITSQAAGGRRQDFNDDYNLTEPSSDGLGSRHRPPYPLESQYVESREQHGRPIPPYPRTPPIPENYEQEHRQQSHGYLQPPFKSPYGQPLHGNNTQPPERQRAPYPYAPYPDE